MKKIIAILLIAFSCVYLSLSYSLTSERNYLPDNDTSKCLIPIAVEQASYMFKLDNKGCLGLRELSVYYCFENRIDTMALERVISLLGEPDDKSGEVYKYFVGVNDCLTKKKRSTKYYYKNNSGELLNIFIKNGKVVGHSFSVFN